jgi:hypothetical protein
MKLNIFSVGPHDGEGVHLGEAFLHDVELSPNEQPNQAEEQRADREHDG